MSEKEERMKRLFPEYFKCFEMPKGAGEERITVYRACRTGECDALSFMSSFEQQGCKYLEDDDPKDPSLYSMSTYEKPKDVKRFVKMNSEFKKPYKIAIGNTEPDYGLVQRTREREKKKKNSHVDWWLYKNAEPYKEFEIIQDFELHLDEYRKKGGGL